MSKLRIDFTSKEAESKSIKITFGENQIVFNEEGKVLYNNKSLGNNEDIFLALNQLFSLPYETRDRLTIANENIFNLISQIVSYKREEYDKYCVHPKMYKGIKWEEQSEDQDFCEELGCSRCKELYFSELIKEMSDKYLVK